MFEAQEIGALGRRREQRRVIDQHAIIRERAEPPRIHSADVHLLALTGIVRQIAITELHREQVATALTLLQYMYGAVLDQLKYHHAELVREAVPGRDFSKAWLIAWTGTQCRDRQAVHRAAGRGLVPALVGACEHDVDTP